jgi:uncharacterized protein YbjT (DUF2867 family)
MTILVVGATGFVGQAAALRLRERGNQVRGLVRGGAAHPKARDLQAAGIAIVEGDLTRPETLAGACNGIETVVCTATSMPAANDGLRRVDLEGTLALMEAAERAGVQRFIYTSYSGNLRFDSPLETAKRSCEDRLLKARMQAIILRPSYFMEMWLSPALGFVPEKGSARIYGSGEAKGSYISAFDVAEFAAAAAVKKIDRRQTILEMGGPEAVSQLDAVRIFEQALHKKIVVEHVAWEALQQQHRAATDPLQKTFAALMLGYAQGDVIAGARETAEQYGVRLRSVTEYATGFRAERAGVA